MIRQQHLSSYHLRTQFKLSPLPHRCVAFSRLAGFLLSFFGADAAVPEMGKVDNHRLPVVRQQSVGTASRSFLCGWGCSMRLVTPKCAAVLIFSAAALLSAVFSVLHVRYWRSGFDAKDSIKLAATVQASFKLQKPVLELVPYLSRLEYDINEEIGVPYSKVAVLSIHEAGVTNWTNVVFGFLSDSIDNSILPVSLSVLKSSLVDLFFQQYNLTLTTSIFGVTSSFEIIKFPGGITIIPEPAAMILQIPEVLFNFTLNSSIYEIRDNLSELKVQLRMGLQLMPDETVFIQATNKNGSTKDPPVRLAASVVTNIGALQPERLKHLAQIITRSPPGENLGLNHTVFGKVKEISLSSFLKHSLHTRTPTPSPCPSPSPSPSPSSEYSPSFSPSLLPNLHHLPPCPNYHTSGPSGADQISIPNDCSSADPPSPSPTSPPKQMFPNLSPHTYSEPPLSGHEPQISPSLSLIVSGAYGSQGPDDLGRKILLSPPHSSSSFASSSCTICKKKWWFFATELMAFLFLLITS